MKAEDHVSGTSGVARPGATANAPLTSADFRILIVDDEQGLLLGLEDLLADEGYGVTTASSGEAALAAAKAAAENDEPFRLVITDLRMPPPDGMEVLRQIKARWPATEVILLTAFATRDTAREALQEGALEYVEKPYKEFEMLLRVGRVFDRARQAHDSARLAEDYQRLQTERQALRRRVEALEEVSGKESTFEQLVARSEAMKEIFDLARKVAATDATVLIRGESGTGKTVLARAIHQASERASRPFLKVNCGALPETLLESELFGHEKGSFTGATARKEGLFTVADKGTVFLDEIGDVSPTIQLKLLQVIEERTFLTVGGTKQLTVDVRIIAATNRALEEAIAEGRFREDLFYRLNIFPITVPPLRDRTEDIPALVERFLKNKGQDSERLSPAALNTLVTLRLPGNVRELENLLERALILAGDQPIGPELIQRPHRIGDGNSMTNIEIPDEGLSLEELEKELIIKAISKAGGNKSKAAALLGLTRRTLYSRMERYAIRL